MKFAPPFFHPGIYMRSEKVGIPFLLGFLLLLSMSCQPIIFAKDCKEMCAPNNVVKLDHEACICEVKKP